MPDTKKTKYLIPDSIIDNYEYFSKLEKIKDRVYPIHISFTTPGHAELFSFDLENCFYAGDSLAIEIQLAVWMGCNPVNIIGVDAEFSNHKHPFYDETSMDKSSMQQIEKYSYHDLKEWLAKIETKLLSKGIRMFNAAGEYSTLDVLPKVRLNAAVGKPAIAITSKTFSNDEYLINELNRYFDKVKINQSKDGLTEDSLIEFLKDCDGMILGTENYSAKVIEHLPYLRKVSKYGVGLNNIDFDAVKRHKVDLTYKKGVNSESVAELVIGHTLNMIRKMSISIQSYREGKWAKLPGKELAEITIGIIGYGHVGKVVTNKFSALGAGRILVNDLLDFSHEGSYEFVPLNYLLSESDVITLHIDADNRNSNFVNRNFIRKMKDGAFIINTSRGTIVDETALVEALKSNKLAGAALDVYKNEPKINKNFVSCKNLLTTCHIAGSSNRAIKNMGWAAIEGLLKLFDINPI